MGLKNLDSADVANDVILALLASPLAEKLISGELDLEKATDELIKAHHVISSRFDEFKRSGQKSFAEWS